MEFYLTLSPHDKITAKCRKKRFSKFLEVQCFYLLVFKKKICLGARIIHTSTQVLQVEQVAPGFQRITQVKTSTFEQEDGTIIVRNFLQTVEFESNPNNEVSRIEILNSVML